MVKRNYSDRIYQIMAMIEQNSDVIDIGTDHAHLPIALAEQQICRSIMAIDVNQKPYEIAKKNISNAGFTNQIDLRLNFDLDGIDLKGEETIVLTGLGGCLISRILDKHKHKFTAHHRFLLQPNWTWFELRKYLAKNGFQIKQEKILNDKGRYYSLLDVQFLNQPYKISNYEAYVGLNQSLLKTKREQEIYLCYLERLKRLAMKKSYHSLLYQAIDRQLEKEIEGVTQCLHIK